MTNSVESTVSDRDALSQGAWQDYVKRVCPENYVGELLQVVREYADHELPHYTDALNAAFRDVQPVFARPRYARFFWHCATTVPGYAARVTVANGRAESEGSAKLFTLWQGVQHDEVAADQVLQHARDESAHSRLFVRLTEAAFPGFLPPGAASRLAASMPDIRTRALVKTSAPVRHEHLVDHLVQMNIGEIRTRLHMHLFAPIIFGFAPGPEKLTTRRILESLVRDEVRHIGYTALLMENWSTDGAADRIRGLYRNRLHIFNQLTVEQTEGAVRSYGRGAFPDLLEI